MVLGYSRCLYGELTEDEKLPALLRCHEHAFDWFGGLTREALYDNAKTLVLRRDLKGRHIVWNPTFWDFAQYYGFIPLLCRPYWPRTKGKIESGVKYIKRSFLPGRAVLYLASKPVIPFEVARSGQVPPSSLAKCWQKPRAEQSSMGLRAQSAYWDATQ